LTSWQRFPCERPSSYRRLLTRQLRTGWQHTSPPSGRGVVCAERTCTSRCFCSFTPPVGSAYHCPRALETENPAERTRSGDHRRSRPNGAPRRPRAAKAHRLQVRQRRLRPLRHSRSARGIFDTSDQERNGNTASRLLHRNPLGLSGDLFQSLGDPLPNMELKKPNHVSWLGNRFPLYSAFCNSLSSYTATQPSFDSKIRIAFTLRRLVSVNQCRVLAGTEIRSPG
jgi:hypothetical protein